MPAFDSLLKYRRRSVDREGRRGKEEEEEEEEEYRPREARYFRFTLIYMGRYLAVAPRIYDYSYITPRRDICNYAYE